MEINFSTPDRELRFHGPGMERSNRGGRFTDADLEHNLAVSRELERRRGDDQPKPSVSGWGKMFNLLK